MFGYTVNIGLNRNNTTTSNEKFIDILKNQKILAFQSEYYNFLIRPMVVYVCKYDHAFPSSTN